MRLLLFDPLAPPLNGWPPGAAAERAYIESIAAAGVADMVANVRTRWLALRSGERVYPVTVNDFEVGDSYVCLPHSAYVLYARRELEMENVGRAKPLFRALIEAGAGLLRLAGARRIVHIDNWLLSTNLHGDWAGEDLPAIRDLLCAAFPGHILAIRSIDAWSSPRLAAAARDDGWLLLASRQIWVVEDFDERWRPRRDVRRDVALARGSPYRYEILETMSEADAARVAELYRLLYVDKYSGLNPVFTPAYVKATFNSGVFAYSGWRGPDNALAAVVGCWFRGGVMTAPIVGYDTARPKSDGLYRLANLAIARSAIERGARLNASSGAADFKRSRGARAEIEYGAYFARHLSRRRRWALASMRYALDAWAVPMMKRRRL